MAQAKIQLRTVSPYPGATMVNDLNAALAALGSGFAGDNDPIALGGVGPYFTWIYTGVNPAIIRRRNAGNTAWVDVGKAFVDTSKASGVTFENTASGLEAETVQAALDELAAALNDLSAASVAYDNTESGLSATSLQEAVDEVVSGLGTASGLDVVTSDADVTAGRLLTTFAGPAQAFRRGNILSTVSQSAGVPTGGIIERGSNANGEYVKLADGTLIMAFRKSINLALPVNDFTLPSVLSSTTAVSISISPSGVVSDWASAPDRGVALTNFIARITGTGTYSVLTAMNAGTYAGATGVAYITVIGRWF